MKRKIEQCQMFHPRLASSPLPPAWKHYAHCSGLSYSAMQIDLLEVRGSRPFPGGLISKNPVGRRLFRKIEQFPMARSRACSVLRQSTDSRGTHVANKNDPPKDDPVAHDLPSSTVWPHFGSPDDTDFPMRGHYMFDSQGKDLDR